MAYGRVAIEAGHFAIPVDDAGPLALELAGIAEQDAMANPAARLLTDNLRYGPPVNVDRSDLGHETLRVALERVERASGMSSAAQSLLNALEDAERDPARAPAARRQPRQRSSMVHSAKRRFWPQENR